MVSFKIVYLKAADKFLKMHEDVREQYEKDMTNDHPENVNVKRIRG